MGFVVATETSQNAPAICRHPGQTGKLYIAWRGGNDYVNVAEWDESQQLLMNKFISKEQTGFTPALAYCYGKLFIVWTGTDKAHTINIGKVDFEYGGIIKQLEFGESIHSAALTTDGNRLFLAWTGTDANKSINITYFNPGLNDNHFFCGQSSLNGPALAINGGVLYLAWVGTDKHVNFAQVNVAAKSSLIDPTRLEYAVTSEDISLLSSNGKLYLAFLGDDIPNHTLNIYNCIDKDPDGQPLRGFQHLEYTERAEFKGYGNSGNILHAIFDRTGTSGIRLADLDYVAYSATYDPKEDVDGDWSFPEPWKTIHNYKNTINSLRIDHVNLPSGEKIKQKPTWVSAQTIWKMDEIVDLWPALSSTAISKLLEQGKTITWHPKIDVQESEKDIVIHADLPGVRKEDIKICLVNNILILSGEKREEEVGSSRRKERKCGPFMRRMRVPGIKQSDIKPSLLMEY